MLKPMSAEQYKKLKSNPINSPVKLTASAGKRGQQEKSAPKALPVASQTAPHSFTRSFGYGAERAAAGLLGTAEGAFDFISAGGNKLLAGITSLGGIAPNRVSNALNSAADYALKNNMAGNYEKRIKERYHPSELDEQATGIAQNVTNLLPSIAIAMSTGGAGAGTAVKTAADIGKNAANLGSKLLKANSGLAFMGTSAAGNAASAAKQQGATTGQALKYGALSGATEVLTEKIAGGIPGLPEGTVTNAIRKTMKNPTVQKAVGKIADIAGEGFEEALSTAVDPVLRRITFDPNADNATKEELLQSAITGALVSGIMQGGAAVAGKAESLSNRFQKPSTVPLPTMGQEAAKTLPIMGDNSESLVSKENKNIHPLPSNRLKLPDAMADDVLVNNNLSRSSEMVNASAEPDLISKVRNKIEELKPLEIAKELTGEEFSKGKNSLTTQVGEFFKSIGNKVTRPNFGEVILNGRGIKDSMAHGIGRKKAITFAAVPDVIQKGKIIDYQKNWKGRKYNTCVIGAPVSIAGEPHYMGVVLLQEPNTNRYYLHEVVTEKGDVSSFKTGSPQKEELPGDNTSAFNQIVSQNQENINSETGLDSVKNAQNQTKSADSDTTDSGVPVGYSDGKLRDALKGVHRNIVSGQAELERIAKLQDKMGIGVANANDLSQASRAVGGTVDYIAEKGLVDRAGNKIGKAWANTVNISQEQLKQLNRYLLHKHNIDRMSLIERTEPTRTAAEQAVNTFRSQYPDIGNLPEYELIKMAQQREAPGTQALASEYLQLLEKAKQQNQVQNKPVIAKTVPGKSQNVPYTAAESAEIVSQMEKEHPELVQQSADYRRFHHDFMHEWAVGSGLMSEEQLNRLEALYPSYVPTYRVKNKRIREENGVIQHGTVNTGSPIEKAVGDLSEIVPLEDAGMMQVNQIARAARRNELFLNLYDTAIAHPQELAPYVKILDSGKEADFSQQNLDDFQKNLEDQAMKVDNNQYKIMAMKNGKPVFMEVNADVYAGLQNLYGQDQGAANKTAEAFGKYLTKPFKELTTGINAFFMARNVIKDGQTAYVNSITNRKLFATYAKDVGSAIDEMIHGSTDWEAFKALGGKQSGFYHNEKGFTQSKAMSERTGISGIWDKTKDKLSFVGENAEAIMRFTEYKAAIKKYGNDQAGKQKAIQAAADVTVNFSRSAPATKFAENFVAYLNASIQGLDKMARQIKEHPVQTTRRSAEIISLPALLLIGLVNKDNPYYDELNNRTKDAYFCIPNPFGEKDDKGIPTTFIKIPKSREYGAAMGAVFERFYRFAVKKENSEDAFAGLGETFQTNLSVPNPVTSNILAPLFINLPTNKDFAGRSIVPERMKNIPPELQYDYSTSGMGKAIAQGINAFPLPKKVSPIQVDYLIDNYTGFPGDMALSATTGKEKGVLGKAKQIFVNPLQRQFTADPLYQSGVTDKFYREISKAENAAAGRNELENLPSEVKTPEEKKVSEMKKASDAVAELRQQERQVLESGASGQDAEQQVREIRKKIIDIAQSAPENAQQAMDEYSKTYVQEISHLTDKRQEQARTGYQKYDIPYNTFLTAYNTLTDIKSDKDKHGKSVGNASQKKKAYIDTMQWLDDSQREYLYDVFEVSKKARGVKIYFEDNAKPLPIVPQKKGVYFPIKR